jgi:hypothetical protein
MRAACIPPFAQETFLEPPPRESGRALALEANYPFQSLAREIDALVARYGPALYHADCTPKSPEEIVDG